MLLHVETNALELKGRDGFHQRHSIRRSKRRNGNMKVDWNMEDLKLPRFSFEGEEHHFYWLQKGGERRRKDQDTFDTLKESTFAESNSYAKVITPYG
jgi:hypothetical protein